MDRLHSSSPSLPSRSATLGSPYTVKSDGNVKAEYSRYQQCAVGAIEEGSWRLAETLSCCDLCWMMLQSKLPPLLSSQSFYLLDLPPWSLQFLNKFSFFLPQKKNPQNQKETSKKPKQETPQTPQKPTTNQNKIKQTKNKTKTQNHLTWPDVISASSAYIPQAFPLLCIVYLDCILWALFSAKCCTYNGD